MLPNWFVGLPVVAVPWHASLLRTAPPGLSELHPDDLHITVAFFGGVSETRAAAGFEVACGLRADPLVVRLSGLEPMGNPRRPTALSVVLGDGAERTGALIASVKGAALEAAGAPADRYGIHPHITVLRPPRRATDEDRRVAVAWAKTVAPLDVAVTLDRVALYTWSEDRRTRKFRVVREHAFSCG